MKKWLFLFLIFPAISFGDSFSVKDLSGGLYSNPSANKIPDNAAISLENFYTDVEPMAIERNGSEKRDTTVLGGTKAVPGLWEFVDNSGQQWIISFSSRSFYKNLVGNTPTIFGQLATADNLVPDCAVNLGKIWCVEGTDSLWWFDGTSTGTVASAPKGTLIEPWRNRLIISNVSTARSTVYVSGDGDGTNWTIGGLATDAFTFQVGGANDGFNITAMWKSYQDNFVISRKKDLWFLAGFDQSDYELRNVSSEIGCIQQGSMREFDGSLLFLSNRGMEELRGYTITHISEPIRNITDTIVKNTASLRSVTDTANSDFGSGTISPATYLSTAAVSGSVVLSTDTGVSRFSDDIDSDFSGTMTNIQISTGNGYIFLKTTGSEAQKDNFMQAVTVENPGCLAPYYRSQSFSATTNYMLTSIINRVQRVGSPGNFKIQIMSNSGNTPGTVLSTGTITTAPLSTSVNTDLQTTLTPDVQISSGTRYWIQMVPLGTCAENVNDLRWWESTASNSNEYLGYDSSLPQSSTRRTYTTYGKSFSSPGNYTSRTFDTALSTNQWIFNWEIFSSSEVSNHGTFTYGTQTSSDGTHWENTATVLNDGVSRPTSTVQRYIRYVTTITAGSDAGLSPSISVVNIPMTRVIRPSGFFTSSVHDLGTSLTALNQITITDQKDGGAISYQFNSSTNSSISLFISTNWVTVISGQIPTSAASRYVAYRSSFSATVGTATVSLDAFTISWNEGGASAPPIVSWVYDRRYWLAFTTATASSPYNDHVLVYQRNRTWTLFTGINAASFATWRDFLYFGNSIGSGYVYKFDVGNSDDGTGITSRIVTKSYDLGDFTKPKDLQSAYANFFGNTASFSGSYSLNYDLDRSGNNYSLGSANMNEGTGEVNAKFPFQLSNPVQGREIQYKITKSGAGDRLKLYELGTIFNFMEEE